MWDDSLGRQTAAWFRNELVVRSSEQSLSEYEARKKGPQRPELSLADKVVSRPDDKHMIADGLARMILWTGRWATRTGRKWFLP